ncbi:MAG: alpha-L-fucosidase [Clostridia bacterium]|nr:alpha-L-fucosidase [Clostridia bacterium]
MTHRTDWFHEAGFGLFIHWTTFSLPENGEKKDYFKAVEDFDLDTFVSQVVASGAKFLFITTSHADMKLPFPLPELDAIVPDHTAKRDLIGELSDRLAPHGIRLMLYFNGEGSTDPAWQEATGFKTDPEGHAEYCYRVTEAISRKYGQKIHGWWIDCCYEPPICGGRGTRYDYARYAACLRAGNPESIVAFNFRGTEPWGCDWGVDIEDYQAGEENGLDVLPTHRFNGESKTQWFGLCWMDDYWVHEKPGTPTPRYDNETVLAYVRKIKENGGVFAYNTAPYQEGHISAPVMEQLTWLRDKI